MQTTCRYKTKILIVKSRHVDTRNIRGPIILIVFVWAIIDGSKNSAAAGYSEYRKKQVSSYTLALGTKLRLAERHDDRSQDQQRPERCFAIVSFEFGHIIKDAAGPYIPSTERRVYSRGEKHSEFLFVLSPKVSKVFPRLVGRFQHTAMTYIFYICPAALNGIARILSSRPFAKSVIRGPEISYLS